jgi:hypothetical protein
MSHMLDIGAPIPPPQKKNATLTKIPTRAHPDHVGDRDAEDNQRRAEEPGLESHCGRRIAVARDCRQVSGGDEVAQLLPGCVVLQAGDHQPRATGSKV